MVRTSVVAFTLAGILISFRSIALEETASVVRKTAARKPVEYFVSPNGSNDRDGQTRATSFADIEQADKVAKPGDTVTLLDGEYDHVWNWTIKTSGQPNAWITYRAEHRRKAVIRSTGRPPQTDYCDAIRVNANYIVMNGFDLISASSGNGVWVEDVHHVVVRNCHARHCGGAGIASHRSDYLTMEDNIVDHNSYTNVYQTSGISLFTPVASDNLPGTRLIIRRSLREPCTGHPPQVHAW